MFQMDSTEFFLQFEEEGKVFRWDPYICDIKK